MKKIYLCGPVSGRPQKEYQKHFYAAASSIFEKAMKNGIVIRPVNPSLFPLANAPWETAMKWCIKEMVYCGGIALLQGWQRSKGCLLELSIAGQLKIPVVYLEPPVDEFAVADLVIRHSDIPRYFNRVTARLEAQGVDERKIEELALYETANRFLDPHGFEYITSEEEDKNEI